VITGASRVEQVHENLVSLAVAKRLDDSLMNQIDAILANKPAQDADWRQYVLLK
jgi:aryl-alcohol dehydrogenase-like predicted oxidoreductase